MNGSGLKVVHFVCRKIDKLVCRVTRLLDECDSIPVRGKNLQYRNACVLVPGHVHPPVQWVLASSFSVVKRSGCETDKALTYSVEVKNKLRYISTPQSHYGLQGASITFISHSLWRK
jgi:hypothetical protein